MKLTSVKAVKTLMMPEEMNATSAALVMTSKQGGTIDPCSAICNYIVHFPHETLHAGVWFINQL